MDKHESTGGLRKSLSSATEDPRGDRFTRHFIIFFSTGIYSGYAPFAPGTAGTVVAVPLYIVFCRLPYVAYGVTVVAFLFMSCWLSRAAESILQKRDSERIVIDEIGGFLVAMAFLPPAPLYILLGFLLFRFFDIVKPFPARRLEAMRWGYGVVADDVVAGIYTNILLQGFVLLIGRKTPLAFF